MLPSLHRSSEKLVVGQTQMLFYRNTKMTVLLA
uniref:Uncharacterized protein n=1 Tax=Triticum urartu TaxID=4572 RepID=A0A8R7TG11_TRIUA